MILDNIGTLRWGIRGGEQDVLESASNRLLLGCRGGLGGLTSEHGTVASHLVSGARFNADIISGSEKRLDLDPVEQELSPYSGEWLSGTKIVVGIAGRLLVIVVKIAGGTLRVLLAFVVSTVDGILIFLLCLVSSK